MHTPLADSIGDGIPPPSIRIELYSARSTQTSFTKAMRRFQNGTANNELLNSWVAHLDKRKVLWSVP